ncbi:hypothetical protein HRH25_19490 [Flavisolibacter sp. BT320]|nr:hypothetical protein [Flavisolibacter longurius]
MTMILVMCRLYLKSKTDTYQTMVLVLTIILQQPKLSSVFKINKAKARNHPVENKKVRFLLGEDSGDACFGREMLQFIFPVRQKITPISSGRVASDMFGRQTNDFFHCMC